MRQIAVSSVVSSRHKGVTNVCVQQQHPGIGVHNGIITVAVWRGDRVIPACGQTDADWAGSCRRLTLRVPATSDAVAFFRFD